VKVSLTDEAKRQARAERTWWRKNRDTKRLFDDELRSARDRLKESPTDKVYGFIDREPVRRMLLEKTRCHLYYVVREREGIVRIVAIWGAKRGRDPEL
jgi:plasmid stabilization system protein ParE